MRSGASAGPSQGRIDQPRRAEFSTETSDPADRFEAWRGIVGLTHEIDSPVEIFQARVSSTLLGDMIASQMWSSPQSVARSSRRIRRDGLDHVTLHLTTAAFDVEMGESRFHVPAGGITVNTLARPFRRSVAPEHGSLVLSLARDLVAAVLPDPEVFHGQVLRDGFGPLLAEHMRTVVQHGHRVEPAAMPGLARATAQLLSAALEPSRARLDASQAARDAAAAVRCKRYIEAHLRSPELGVDTICRQVGLSRAVLYRLFAEHGGVLAYIQGRRLDAARKTLLTMEKPRVTEVAYAFGFTNTSAFSRAFRQAFGTSPSEAADSAVSPRVGEAVFETWMKAVAQDGV